MSHRRVTVLLLVMTTLAGLGAGAVWYRRYHKRRFWAPINNGSFTGPLTVTASRYDPSKPPSRPWLDPERAAPPLTTYQSYLASAIDDQRTDFLIYLPPGYNDPANADRRYPVIYWLHGYHAAPQYGMPFVEALDAAIRGGDAPPIIAVLPNGLVDSWYVDAVDGSQPVESVIVTDLIPYVDKTWRTQPDRRARAVEGFSMGAWGAAHLAFKYPDLFCAATLISAPLHTHSTFPQIQRIFAGSPEAYYAQDPVTRINRDAVRLREIVRVRILIGSTDAFLPFARAFDTLLQTLNVPRDLTIIPGVGHDDEGVYRRAGPGAFGFYKTLFAEPRK